MNFANMTKKIISLAWLLPACIAVAQAVHGCDVAAAGFATITYIIKILTDVSE